MKILIHLPETGFQERDLKVGTMELGLMKRGSGSRERERL